MCLLSSLYFIWEFSFFVFVSNLFVSFIKCQFYVFYNGVEYGIVLFELRKKIPIQLDRKVPWFPICYVLRGLEVYVCMLYVVIVLLCSYNLSSYKNYEYSNSFILENLYDVLLEARFIYY